jgi:hypothetical protein
MEQYKQMHNQVGHLGRKFPSWSRRRFSSVSAACSCAGSNSELLSAGTALADSVLGLAGTRFFLTGGTSSSEALRRASIVARIFSFTPGTRQTSGAQPDSAHTSCIMDQRPDIHLRYGTPHDKHGKHPIPQS